MKKLIFTLFIIHCSLLIANAQWVQQNTGTTTDFHSVKFINKYTGWACGTGTILKTTNGGVNWIAQSHPATSKRLASLCIVDSLNLYCVGWFETILKTTDGGLNWTAIRNGPGGTGSSYEACFFINKNTGWITGSGNYIWKTTNGCDSLVKIYTLWGYLNDIYFKDSLTGLMCGDGGALLRTTNGGINWYTPNIQLHYIGYNFDKLAVINKQYCWIIGRNTNPVYHSTDFGENWDSIGYVTNGYQIYCVYFSSLNTGWCGGGGVYQGRLFKTTNSGFSWSWQQRDSVKGYVAGFWFYNDSIGWAVGSNGMILHTTTSGNTFINRISSSVPESFSLNQNYPNPFNNSTIIEFTIKEKDIYTFEIYDVLGRKVQNIFSEIKNPGVYRLSFNGANLNSGIYFYRLYSTKNNLTKKLILIK
jgi:photosystem II stability/assembly factor-like uncharacterized protein